MKNSKTKKLLSILLAVIMVVGMIPATTLTADAALYTPINTWDELESALNADGYGYLKLMCDVKHYHEKLTEGHKTTVIKGEKIIDLNGFLLECEDKSNIVAYSYNDSSDCAIKDIKTLFSIPYGAKLTVNDSGDKGKIFYDGSIIWHTAFSDMGGCDRFSRYRGYAYRDLFDVEGTLVINGGTIQAGRKEQQWIYRGRHCETNWSYYADWHGNAQQQIWGTVANVKKTGVFIVTDGDLSGRGMNIVGGGSGFYGGYCVADYRDEVINIDEGGKVYIYGGTFTGNGGANVFAGDGVENGITIRAGTFKTDKHDKIRVLDWVNKGQAGGGKLNVRNAAVGCGFYGNLGIPESAWKSELKRIKIIRNGETYTYENWPANGIELNKTEGVKDGEGGEKMNVTFVPCNTDKVSVHLNGAIYSDYIVSDNQTIYWNAASEDNLTATVKYKPYYTDNLENYSVLYNWKLYNSISDFDYEVTTLNDTLDITETIGDSYFKGDTSVSCQIVEKADNISPHNYITSDSYKFKLNATRTPLDETSLPGGGMNVNISYPNFSGSGSDILISVSPTVQQLNQEVNGNCTVKYQYTYRDYSLGKNVTDSLSNDKYSLDWLDWGHVSVGVTMIVYGADGIAKRFTEDTWALKLPDIKPTGGRWNSSQTVFTGNSGSSVTLTAPIDTTNAAVEDDKIVASDIVGWYKLTYDTNGNPVYSYIGGNKSATANVSQNGMYCYIAKDRNGNNVTSKPIQVLFDADMYSLRVVENSNDGFYINADGTTTSDVLLTALGGSSITKSMLRWRVVSWPVGGDACLLSYAVVNSNTSFTKNISNFFVSTKYNEIVPGDYVIQLFAQDGNTVISASNQITVNVKRASNSVDIMTDDGRIVTNKTIEGPYVGETMQLTCVPSNGANQPEYTNGVAWEMETLLGTNVATIDQNGLITATNPGQIKVTATIKYMSENIEKTHVKTVIINVPITDVEVTLGTPEIGGAPDAIASVPADAPYKLVYDEYSWVSGVHPDTDLFHANLIPQLSVNIAPKDGYVFPARQSELADGDKTWFTYADDIKVKVNGTDYNFRDFEKNYVYGYTEWKKEYDGTFWEAQKIDFYWTWERLKDASHTYLDYVELTTEIPYVGDAKSNLKPECTNSEAIYSYGSGIYKVSGDYLNDNNISNDNAVSMAADETFEKGQIYRTGVYFTTNNNNNYTTHFANDVTLIVNGTRCYIQPIGSSGDLEGSDTAVAYFYFIPKAKISTTDKLWIDGLKTPVGFEKPVSAQDITGIYTSSSNTATKNEEFYVTRLQWFLDMNNNNILDDGEDSADCFNEDGTFVSGLRYSVYIELAIRDRDGDGVGDYQKFGDNLEIALRDQSNEIMNGNQNGAVYKFPVTTMPKKAVVADPSSIVFELADGYTAYPSLDVNIISVGSSEITSVTAEAADATLLEVGMKDSMTVTINPTANIEKGIYDTYLTIKDKDDNILLDIPITIYVGEQGVSGTITSGSGDADVETLIEITKTNEARPSYETAVKGNNAVYSIPNIPNGTYSMTVTKAGHMPYQCTIEIDSETVIHNVDLKLFADNNFDGDIDEQDYQALVNVVLADDHEQIETEEYDDLIHYDLVMDGYLDVLDAAVMALVVNGHKTIDEVYDLQKGDYDYDGEAFTESDIAAIYHVLFNVGTSASSLTTVQKFAADLNYNGKVDDDDLTKLVGIYGNISSTSCEDNVKVYYRWGNNYTTCTATAMCTLCNKKVAEEKVTSVQNTDGSYTATFTNPLLGTKTFKKQ